MRFSLNLCMKKNWYFAAKCTQNYLGVDQMTSTQLAYETTWVLIVHETFRWQVLIFMYKYIQDLIPSSLQNIFTFRSHITRRQTRSNDHFYISCPRLKSVWSLFFHGPTLWNSHDSGLRSVDNLANFKSIRLRLIYIIIYSICSIDSHIFTVVPLSPCQLSPLLSLRSFTYCTVALTVIFL